MKKAILLSFVFFVQMTWACHCLSFKEAQEKALKENKFLLVHFSNSFYMDDKGEGIMSLPTLDVESNKVTADFVFVCVPKRDNAKLLKVYNVTHSFELLIIDPNGFELFRFRQGVSEMEIYNVLANLLIPKNFFSNDLISYHEKNAYAPSLRIAQKYFDYTLLTDQYLENNVISIANAYLKKAEGMLSDKEENFKEKKQKLELLKLFHWAYEHKFDVLNEKINTFTPNDIIVHVTFTIFKIIANQSSQIS